MRYVIHHVHIGYDGQTQDERLFLAISNAFRLNSSLFSIYSLPISTHQKESNAEN